MKKLNTLIVMVAAAAFANAGTIEETVVVETPSIVDVSTSYNTDKVWRGSDIGQNEAVATLTTGFELPAQVGLDLSADYSLAEGSQTVSDEATDVTAVFSKSVADYLLSLSYTWYSEGFDQAGNKGGQEAGLSVSKDVGPVNLTLTQYLAVQGDNNAYSEIKGVYSNDFGVLPKAVDFTTTVGYLAQDGAFTHAETRISTNVPVVEGIVAQPFVAYSIDLGGEFVETFSGENFFGGVEFKRAF